MTRERRTAWHFRAMVIATATAGLAGLSSSGPDLRAADNAIAAVPPASPANGELRAAERTFLVEAAQNGRDEADLSRLALSLAAASSLREFAQQVLNDCTAINSSLEGLAQRKALEIPLEPTSFTERHQRIAARSGAAFDRAFIAEMTEITRRALQACEAAVANAKDPDVRHLAGTLLPVLRGHANKAIAFEQSL